MAFPNNPTPHQATPYHQTEYQTPAALQSPNVPMPQQPMQMPGQPPMMGGGVGVGPQGPPVGAVPPGAGLPPNATTPPQTPKGPTPSETSSNQRNQLAKWESDEPLGDQATIAMILYSNQNHPELKSQYPEWKDRIKQIAKIWKNLPNDKRQPYVQNARENRTASRMNKQVNTSIFFDTLMYILIYYLNLGRIISCNFDRSSPFVFFYFNLSFIYNPTNKKLYLHGSTSILDNFYSKNQEFVLVIFYISIILDSLISYPCMKLYIYLFFW